MYDVAALGELLIDFTPSGTNDQGIALFGRNPGGAPANVLAMMRKLGSEQVAFIGKVGSDGFGQFLQKTLTNVGIDVTGLILDPQYLTTLAFVQLSDTGDRSFSFYRREGADLMLRWDEIRKELIDNAKIFHFGSVSLSGEPCRGTVAKTVDYAKSKGKVISYDPNYRPFLWSSEAEAKVEIGKFLTSADILKVSEEEMTLLTGETDLAKGADKLAVQGAAVVLVSLGADGAYYRCADGAGKLSTYDVKTIDTTGAGDAFLGAVLYQLKDKSRAQLEAITKGELAAIVDFANAAGSLTTTKKGAIPALPSLAEIVSCQKSKH
ncbi:MAG: carbohydrate kinase [Deferribacteraceae bacterium]|jgi:fructokinase|nr:carbohydrate kinase [Deferribacteraceae bacterium]